MRWDVFCELHEDPAEMLLRIKIFRSCFRRLAFSYIILFTLHSILSSLLVIFPLIAIEISPASKSTNLFTGIRVRSSYVFQLDSKVESDYLTGVASSDMFSIVYPRKSFRVWKSNVFDISIPKVFPMLTQWRFAYQRTWGQVLQTVVSWWAIENVCFVASPWCRKERSISKGLLRPFSLTVRTSCVVGMILKRLPISKYN